MYRSILVPLDGSPFGERALPYAIALARRFGASIRLAHVHMAAQAVPYLEPLTPYQFEGVEEADRAEDRHAWESELDYLERVARKVDGGSGLEVSTVLLHTGPVAEMLRRRAAEGVDLVVMTTHGRNTWGRMWLGSVADELVRHAPVPLLMIRPESDEWMPPAEPSFRHVFLPLDGSDLAEQVVDHALALNGDGSARFTLLAVVAPAGAAAETFAEVPAAWPQWDPDRRVAHAQEMLDRVARRLKERATEVETFVALGRDPAASILEHAAAVEADVIAMATHGRSGLFRLVLGSVTSKVVRGAHVPVLAYRPVSLPPAF